MITRQKYDFASRCGSPEKYVFFMTESHLGKYTNFIFTCFGGRYFQKSKQICSFQIRGKYVILQCIGFYSLQTISHEQP